MHKFKALLTNYQGVILGFLILSLGFDFLDKIGIFYNIELLKLNRIIKAIFILYAVVFILTHYKYVLDNLKLLMGFIILLSFLFLLKNNFSHRYVDEYLRYIFPLLVFPLIHFANLNTAQNFATKLYKLFIGFIVLNAIYVFLGLIFEILIFQTYQYHRFGYNGIILSQGFTPYLYLCATTLFWAFKNKKMILLTLVIASLSGVKGVFFAEFLLVSLLIVFDSNLKKSLKFKILIAAFIAFIGLLVGLFLTPLFQKVIKSDGLFTAIFSYRTDNTLELFNELSSINYSFLFGTIGLEIVRLELQMLDIMLFFGIIGLLGYSVFIYFLYTHLVNNYISKAFFITIIALSILSGNLFYIPLSTLLMFLVLFALHKKKDLNDHAF
ncbi:hypothetical protein [Bizionia arctica]|nr:hypothetical protein [Bizionia arctica]